MTDPRLDDTTVEATPACKYANGKHDFRAPVGDGSYRCSAPGCYATGLPFARVAIEALLSGGSPPMGDPTEEVD